MLHIILNFPRILRVKTKKIKKTSRLTPNDTIAILGLLDIRKKKYKIGYERKNISESTKIWYLRRLFSKITLWNIRWKKIMIQFGKAKLEKSGEGVNFESIVWKRKEKLWIDLWMKFLGDISQPFHIAFGAAKFSPTAIRVICMYIYRAFNHSFHQQM